MKISLVLFIIFSLGFLIACEKVTNQPSDNYLSGRWTEHLPDGKAYYEGTLHSFSFMQDSFTAKIIWWTDVIVIIPSDPCPSTGYEITYIKGKYSLANDSIYFSGKLCDSLYQNLQATCSGVADYKEQYKFTKNDTAIILNEVQESIYGYGIVLKKE